MKSVVLLSLGCVLAGSLHAQTGEVTEPLEKLVEKAASIVKRETGSAPTLEVKLRTDKLVYRPGEELQAFVTVPPKSHVRLYYKDAEGGVTVLFPNALSAGSELPGGKEVPLPAPTDQWKIVIGGKPAGREFLALVVSDRPFADAAELSAAIQRDGGQAEMGDLKIEEIVGKGPRALLVDPPKIAPAPTAPPDSRIGIAMVEITTSPE